MYLQPVSPLYWGDKICIDHKLIHYLSHKVHYLYDCYVLIRGSGMIWPVLLFSAWHRVQTEITRNTSRRTNTGIMAEAEAESKLFNQIRNSMRKIIRFHGCTTRKVYLTELEQVLHTSGGPPVNHCIMQLTLNALNYFHKNLEDQRVLFNFKSS